MTAGGNLFRRFAQIIITLTLSTLSLPSPAAPEDCIEQGGQATCKTPILVATPWQYALCDDAPASLGRAAAWCAVMGGSWSGGGCAGATPPAESTVYSLAYAFEQSIHSPCQTSGSDNGWLAPGGFLDSWNCRRGGPRYQSGIETFNLREMPFTGQSYDSYTKSCGGTWTERVIALRTRSVVTGCPDDYTLRSSRFTGQLECYRIPQVTCRINLSGFPAEVEPGGTVDNLQAQITCTGRSPEGIAVTATADVAANSGGHQHDDGRRPAHAGTVGSPKGNAADSDGVVPLTFTAPAPAGKHTVTVRCIDIDCGSVTGAVWVGVRGLRPIPASDLYQLIGETNTHPDNHYLTSRAAGVLARIANTYKLVFVDRMIPPAPVLHVNDASLEHGGLFDIKAKDGAPWTTPHPTHRFGTEIDIRANPQINPETAIPAENFEQFELFVGEAKSTRCPAVGPAYPGTDNQHYHVCLTGGRCCL